MKHHPAQNNSFQPNNSQSNPCSYPPPETRFAPGVLPFDPITTLNHPEDAFFAVTHQDLICPGIVLQNVMSAEIPVIYSNKAHPVSNRTNSENFTASHGTALPVATKQAHVTMASTGAQYVV